MSKDANPGELRTPILIQNRTASQDSDGYPTLDWTNIYPNEQTIRVKWVNLHGVEVWQAMSLDLTDSATVTCRYSPLINATCRILKVIDISKFQELMLQQKSDEADALFYQIVSLDNVDEQNEWLELKVGRKVESR